MVKYPWLKYEREKRWKTYFSKKQATTAYNRLKKTGYKPTKPKMVGKGKGEFKKEHYWSFTYMTKRRIAQ